MALLSSFGKRGAELGLLTRKVDIEDTEYASKFFVVSEFNPVFAAGKNPVSFNGSTLLKNKSEILVECIDSQGNSLYLEHAKSQDAQYSDTSKFVVSVHIYNETYNGAGKFILVGTTAKDEIVRWIANITIDKTRDNFSKVRFYNKPELEVRPLLYPVVDTEKAQVDYPPPPAVQPATGTAAVDCFVGAIRVTGKGAGYSQDTTTVTLVGGVGDGGRAATATIQVGGDGGISSITVTDTGTNYTNTPEVQINGTSTTTATAVAVLRRPVVSVSVDQQGEGYTFTPNIKFVPTNGGYGAQASATVTDGKVTSVTVIPTVDGQSGTGDGYEGIPTVAFDFPPKPAAPDLNIPIVFTSSFVTYAGTPPRDTNKNVIDLKRTDIDYRLMMTSSRFYQVDQSGLEPSIFPSKSFNTQMEGQTMTAHITRVKPPYSYADIPVNITASFTIKKVLDGKTVMLNEPFFYTQGKNQFVGEITEGMCYLSYRLISYNTAPDSSKTFFVSSTDEINVKESHAEVVYRNLKCFSGFVARHKLYRKSSFYPGAFQLISDELLGAAEMLLDPITFNKFYDRMGVFYHQPHIAKYWWPTSDVLSLTALSSPIHSMKVWAASFDASDGNHGVMVKNDSIGVTNDNMYYPYNEEEFNDQSGKSYNSNFLSLKKDVLYVLSTNISMEKDANDTTAKVSFYFTSSIDSIKTEKAYEKNGLKLGEIVASKTGRVQYFNDRQYMYFTPTNDYFGTVVVVPYHCNVTLTDFSLKVYGDYGFSPDIQVIRIPFKVNVKNEAFDIKAELLDLNSNVVYSNLRTVQSFDSDGESLYSYSDGTALSQVINVTHVDNSYPTVTIIGKPYMPDLENCGDDVRLVGWHVPTGGEDDGKLCYTNVSKLYIDSDDYIVLHEYQSGVEVEAKSIAVQYDFAKNIGRKIYIDAAGNKETFP